MARSSIEDKRYGRIAKELAAARKAAGLSQVELARMIGITQSYLSKIERNERYLDVVQFVDMCRALNIKPTALLRRVFGLNWPG